MPKARKASSSAATSVSNAKLGRLFAETAAFADDDDDCSIGEDPYYAGGFGMRRGTVCHCSRCLRRSGPLTDDPGQVVDDIVNFFEDVDVDGTATGFDCGDLEEHHRLVAATTSLAVERGDADVLRTILSNLSDHGIQAELATRLAVPAAQHGHAHLIFLLDDYQADFEEPDPARGGPPLMHAANNGHVAAVNALLECGTDSEAADYQSQTALMVAVFSDRANAAEALLAKGAKVDAVDYKGRTALSHAARYGSLDCISVLAQHNADVFHIDKDGRTPIDIAEDCSRFEAAAQLKRLQQRQRLRVRKEMRQKEVGPDRKFDRLELMQKEAEALRHALALVEEEENEALQKARKQKARKAKKKARAQDATASAAKEANGDENGTIGSSHQDARTPPEEDAMPSEAVENTGRASSSSSREATPVPEAQRAPPDLKAEEQRKSEDAPADPVTHLRSAWDALLKEAAGCKDANRQVILVDEVRNMVDKCVTAGVSVKYGKKVLGKLEKATAVRSALTAALNRGPSLDPVSLEDLVVQAKGLKSLMDDSLLTSAEDSLRRAREEAGRSQLKIRPKPSGQQPLAQQPAGTNGHIVHKLSAEVLAVPQRSRDQDLQPLRATEPAISAAAEARRMPNPAASSQLPSSRILHSLGAHPSMLNGKPDGLQHANGGVNGGLEGPASRGPAPQRLPSPGGPPGSAQNGRIHNRPVLLPAPLPVQSRSEVRPQRLDPYAGRPQPSKSPAPQMHDQGLASIWPRSMPFAGPEPVPLPQGPNPFFSGSLFEAPLAMQRPAPASSAGARPAGSGAQGPRSLFSAAPSNSWSPLEGRDSGPHDWLGDLLGPSQQQAPAAFSTPNPHASDADIWSDCFPLQAAAAGRARQEDRPPHVHRLWTNGDSMQRPAPSATLWKAAGATPTAGPQEIRRPPEPW